MRLAINPLLTRLRCSATGFEVDSRGFARPPGRCDCCAPPGKPVLAEYDLRGVARTRLPSTAQGLFRWAPLLPVSGVPDGYAEDVGRGAIARHAALSEANGVEVYLQSEGGNPTGSFKDRGLAIGVALGAACGARRFALPTQGNAGVAAALFCARLGLEGALVYMPEGWADGPYHRACAHFGGEVRFAGANIAEAGDRMRADLADVLADGRCVDLSTFCEPGRLEGKKTLGLDLFRHFAPGRLPDWILYPTGGGTGLVGIWKAFAELRALERIPRGAPLPRLAAVQSDACAPVVRAFERGLAEVEPLESVESAGTLAVGLDVPRAIMGHGILRALRESNGTAVSVSEASIASAFWQYGRLGIAAGYEAAALRAALSSLRRTGDIAPGSRVLLVHTSGALAALGR